MKNKTVKLIGIIVGAAQGIAGPVLLLAGVITKSKKMRNIGIGLSVASSLDLIRLNAQVQIVQFEELDDEEEFEGRYRLF